VIIGFVRTRHLVPNRDAFCLFYDAKTGAVKALNGSGRAPKRLNIDYIRQRGIEGRRIPLNDLNTVTVPGRRPVGQNP
jgi:gamma-glutamyltranspeptidase/glutathione hydrolase